MSNYLIFEQDSAAKDSGDSSPKRLRDAYVSSAMDDYSRNTLYCARSKLLSLVNARDEAANAFNPSDTDPDVTLSFANHAAEKSTGFCNYRSLRGTYPIVPNKKTYFEFHIIKAPRDDLAICFGLSSKSMTLNTLVGMKSHTIGLYSNGNVVCNNKWMQLRSDARIRQGSIIGISVEMLHYRIGTGHCNNVGLVSFYIDGEPVSNPRAPGRAPSTCMSCSVRSGITSPQLGTSYMMEAETGMNVQSYEEMLRNDLQQNDIEFRLDTPKTPFCCDCAMCSKEMQLAAAAALQSKPPRKVPSYVRVSTTKPAAAPITPTAQSLLSPTGDPIFDQKQYVDDGFSEKFCPSDVQLPPAYQPRTLIDSDVSDESSSPDSDPLSPVSNAAKTPLGATKAASVISTRTSTEIEPAVILSREDVLAKLDDPYIFVVRFAPHRNIYPTVSFYNPGVKVVAHFASYDIVHGDCVTGQAYSLDKRLLSNVVRHIDDDEGPFDMMSESKSMQNHRYNPSIREEIF